ncbi:hypothetical protein [Winogradskya humida]|uniref:Uncharacterized protein n=1 Tax=Winogradskya humida TaxID=113566 RepID=A0ABQ3ZQ32_9ACTN|nr:hypothetical protein [Actinoplanes humidus]GIE20688.1 hypothetical protein Ahu01nite_037900 [Actinoplanes humidus]
MVEIAVDEKRRAAIELAREMLADGRLEFRVRRSLDGELLDEAQRQISAASPELAISEALRRLVEEGHEKRRAARRRLEQMYDKRDGQLPADA